MSNDLDKDYVGGVSRFAEKVKVIVNQVATAVRQFWEGYLLSPNGC